MAANLSSPWNPTTDARLEALVDEGMYAFDIADAMGLTVKQVRGRAARLGLTIKKMTTNRPKKAWGVTDSHRAADERSAEILRNVGMRI